MESLSLPEVWASFSVWLIENGAALASLAALVTILGFFFRPMTHLTKSLVEAGGSQILRRFTFRRQRGDHETVRNFRQLAMRIRPLLTENHLAFSSFGPRSDRNSLGPVRWDLSLWEHAKVDKIAPNNQKILDLIDKNATFIPPKYMDLFNQMRLHVYAFEKHCSDPNFDYSDFRYPQGFGELIEREGK